MARSQGMKPTRETEIAFITNPMGWPRWPLLPLKRRDKASADPNEFLGFMFADSSPVVYCGLIYNVVATFPPPKTWKETLSALKSETYENLDHLLETWEID